MRTYLECIPCFVRQALQAGKIATKDKKLQKQIMDETAKAIIEIDMETLPPLMGKKVHALVKRIVKNNDPYKKLKDKYNRLALALYPELKRKVEKAKDPLLAAVRTAIAGNVIDFGIGLEFDLRKDIEHVMKAKFAVFDYAAFKKLLKKQKTILYLGDNAGETVFDRVLIEYLKDKLGKEVIYAVKAQPIINDATKEDAVFAGLDKCAKIISSGCTAPGTVLSECSDDFIKIYKNSKLIIAKGQGNYEVLNDEKRPIFFMLKAKCEVVAAFLKVKQGSIILKYNGRKI